MDSVLGLKVSSRVWGWGVRGFTNIAKPTMYSLAQSGASTNSTVYLTPGPLSTSYFAFLPVSCLKSCEE